MHDHRLGDVQVKIQYALYLVLIPSQQHRGTTSPSSFTLQLQKPKIHLAAMMESFGNYDLVKKIKLDFADVVVSK